MYLFSGYQGTTQPFAETAPGTVAYAGDQGQRLIQISASRQVPVSDAGTDIFQTIKNGNGTFIAAAAAANTGTGMIGPGTVTNPTQWGAAGNPQDFSVVFFVDSSVTPPVTTYDISDNVSGLSLTTDAAPGPGPYLRTYQDGAAISLSGQAPPDTNPVNFDFGAQIEIQGEPATGDTAWVEAQPRTGRLHQIRRHLKHISCPLIGDVDYGKGEHNRLFRERYDLHRLALHASSLTVPHPADRRPIRASAPMPADFAVPLARLAKATETP